MGAGHTVTAFYEVVPVGAKETKGGPAVDSLKYQTTTGLSPEAISGELMTVKLRYKRPDGDTSTKISHVVTGSATPLHFGHARSALCRGGRRVRPRPSWRRGAEGVSLQHARSIAASFAAGSARARASRTRRLDRSS